MISVAGIFLSLRQTASLGICRMTHGRIPKILMTWELKGIYRPTFIGDSPVLSVVVLDVYGPYTLSVFSVGPANTGRPSKLMYGTSITDNRCIRRRP